MKHPKYLAFVRTLPCLIGKDCMGQIEADHMGLDRGIGKKACDTTAAPLCHKHHMERHAFAGHFRNFKAYDMRHFRACSILKTRQAWLATGAERLWADDRRAA